MLGASPQKTKARAVSWSEPRAFSAAAHTRTPARGLYACDARRCPVLAGRCIRVPEASHRLYNCARCAQQVQICRRCDRGNRYCAGSCAQLRRRESLRRAGRRYQRSLRGACHHAARQRAWRERAVNKVTHQGSPALAVPATVSTSANASPGEPRHDDIVPVPARALAFAAHQAAPRCSFCRRVLSVFARLGFVRGGP
jgi:hypothetical protein